MAIRKSLELKGDTVLFNLYKVVDDRLVQVSELPQLKAGDINLEMTFNHIERDEFTIDFKNYNQFNILKNIFNNNDIVLELVLYNKKIGDYQPINLYYMTGFNEVYNGNSEWEVSISGTDWKGFIEERRYILHNVIDKNPDNPDFDKVRFTLHENINSKVFFPLIDNALKSGKNISKGAEPKISNDRKINILNNMIFKLKEDITIPNYLQDKCYISDFRKQWCDICFSDINWFYSLDRPKVTTKKNNGMIDLYYNQQNVHFVNYKNTKDVINKLEIINDKSDYKDSACVYSQEKDAISYQLNGIKYENRIAIYDAEITDAPYADNNITTLITKAKQEINTNTNTYTFNADIELVGLPLVDWTVGDVVSFQNFPVSINGAFEITSIQLSANHDNGYLEFKINETLERPNVFREQDFLEN